MNVINLLRHDLQQSENFVAHLMSEVNVSFTGRVSAAGDIVSLKRVGGNMLLEMSLSLNQFQRPEMQGTGLKAKNKSKSTDLSVNGRLEL